MKGSTLRRLAVLFLLLGFSALGAVAATRTTSLHKHTTGVHTARHRTRTTATAASANASLVRDLHSPHHGRGAHTVLAVRRTRLSSRYGERFTASSFADIDNLTLGDVTDGEDPIVRAAALEALGNMNGTALAIDPSSGRILAMVNQKLALSPGAEPCSTIKLSVALAALDEGIVKPDTPVNLGGGYKVNMTYALARSINPYFEVLGRTLGFERVKHYANMFGLGELAGYNIQGEQLGKYPDHELPEAQGGVGRMCSFGESVSMTPLQLGALVAAIANGGTLYYLQHPQTPEEIASFEPRVKRILDIAPIIPDILPGMAGAVSASFGTARSLRSSFTEFPVMGKTGTCSNNGTRYGWFASFANTPSGRIVTVFFLEGGRPTFGPKAAELTGQFYRALWDRNYFQPKAPTAIEASTSSLTGTK
ncbi:MAG TPA: penicillin-binding transpeptidase domain-containing protein [Granulicella sp.]|jgi:penicillin-binding protein 2|nr:penicillin-binding transpeptidase domain-containing protein [Granulicella sp.]